jgi:glycine/D-amino acid oxidase-like deaminating enzyme
MELPKAAPCVVVGGGIAGVALAAHLARLGMEGVVLLERESGLGEGATSRSAGGIRQQFADPDLVRAARATAALLRTFEAETGVDPEFRAHGYLLVATEEARAGRLRAEAAAQRAAGLAVEHLDAGGVARLFPCLSVGDVAGANFCPTDGYLSPHGLVEGYRALARRHGAVVVLSREAVTLEVRGGRVRGVRTAAGTVEAPLVAVAAGSDAGPLLAAAGVRVPLRPTMRRLWFTHPLPGLPRDLPLVLDLDRPFYFRPESGGALLSLAEVEEGGRAEAPSPGDGSLPDRLAERALNRCPLLGDARILRAWWGFRTLTPDDLPVLGEAPEVPGLWLAVGFGGHGITHGPSLCLALAEELALGAPRLLPLDPYRPGRPSLAAAPPPPGVI